MTYMPENISGKKKEKKKEESVRDGDAFA